VRWKKERMVSNNLTRWGAEPRWKYQQFWWRLYWIKIRIFDRKINEKSSINQLLKPAKNMLLSVEKMFFMNIRNICNTNETKAETAGLRMKAKTQKTEFETIEKKIQVVSEI